ncbi:MAG: hypothetical protein IJX14_00880, partial [Clostridia bacterium]|nr:hypothetical protein [Clostridia bacterium]
VLTYEIARLSIPDVYMVIPFSDGHVYREGEGLPEGDMLAPELALVLLADCMKDLGNVPWVASWRFEDDTSPAGAASLDAVELPGHWRSLLQQLNLPVFADFLYRWEPEACLQGEKSPYRFADRYEALCEKLAAADPRAVVLSLARVADRVNPAMYADLTALQDPTGNQVDARQVRNRAGVLMQGLPDRTEGAWVPLLDFAKSYSAGGFVAGGRIDSITTSYSDPMKTLTGEYTRVMRCVLPWTDDAGAGGILLRDFEKPVDLSMVDSLYFTFLLEGKGDTAENPPSAIFFIGDEDWRIEYHVTGSVDGDVMTVQCNIGDWENVAGTGYIGVMLSGETELTFDLASVYACSTVLAQDALEQVFAEPEETMRDTRFDTEVFYILLLLTVTTVCVGVLLFRREREEEETENAERK